MVSDDAALWAEVTGKAIADEVDRLWPHEGETTFRAACLAEEAGEVNRANTKRRHATHAPDGRCKGLTVEDWSNELAKELAQVVVVALDLAHREGIDLVAAVEVEVAKLQAREAGT